MRRVFLGPVLFLLLGAALGWGLDRASVALAPPYPDEAARFVQLEGRREQIRVLALGNSHCLAVDFHALGLADRAYHLWHPGQDLFEVESQLRRLLPRLPAVETALFSVSFASFHRDNRASTLGDRDGVRRKFYGLPPAYPPVPGDWRNWMQGRLAALVREDHWQSVFSALALRWQPGGTSRPAFLVPDDTGLLDLRRTETEGDHAEMTAMARGITVKRHWDLQRNMMENNPELPESAFQSMRRSLGLLGAQGIRVVCFSAPMFEAYAKAYDKQTIDEMHGFMARLVDEFGIEYHDFSNERQFSDVARLFANPDHLNVEGSAAFSRTRLRPLLERRP